MKLNTSEILDILQQHQGHQDHEVSELIDFGLLKGDWVSIKLMPWIKFAWHSTDFFALGTRSLSLSAMIAALIFALLSFAIAAPLKLTLLHTNDHHSHLEKESIEIDQTKVSGISATNAINIGIGGYPRIVSAYAHLKQAAETAGRAVLKMHAGDAITGTAYYSMFKGEADAKMMSLLCFDAFTLGNHEFDDGDASLAKFIDKLQTMNASCATPVVATNVVPGASSPLLGKLKKSLSLTVGSEQVGVVGIDIRNKTMLSSSPSAGTILTDERTTAQAEIDVLLGNGVNKIILVTHLGYDNDLSLMATLRGVDVVIGGDSHSLLGNDFTKSAAFSSVKGDYATEVTNAGKKVCVVQARATKTHRQQNGFEYIYMLIQIHGMYSVYVHIYIYRY